MPRSEVQESCTGTSGVAEFLQGFKGPTEPQRETRGAPGTPSRDSAIAELSRAGWGANTIGGQLPKELADKRATTSLRD